MWGYINTHNNENLGGIDNIQRHSVEKLSRISERCESSG